MEIEKVLVVDAPADRVWSMLLDPNVMGGCVPGMKSIQVVSDVEYIAVIHVKISFISAKFKLNTKIVEQRAPNYLRTEGTGEDASVASSLKQQSEIFLTALDDGKTELRIKVKVDVLGRLGSFGLSVMKTKADRMWDEFGQNLVNRLNGVAGPESVVSGGASTPSQVKSPPAKALGTPAEATSAAVGAADTATTVAAEDGSAPGAHSATVPPHSATASTLRATVDGQHASRAVVDDGNWWTRLLRGKNAAAATSGTAAGGPFIHVELRRGDTTVNVDWPIEGSRDCAAWLTDVLK
ncbi:CoxG family protein [Pigmentiphaga litoralis]|uniref:CoxG family protein n=1 Tax=Pigmentiphaga litoralis TaxID=516702 RepID=UPI003B42E012